MNTFAGSETNDFLAILAQQYSLFGDLRVVFYDTDNIAVAYLVIKTEQQVGRAQMKEVQGMRLQCLPIVHQAAYFLGRRCQLRGSNQHVGGLGSGEMMAHRTDAAEPLYQYRQLPVGSALDELFKAAKLDNVQACLTDFQVFILQQRYLAMTFDTGQWLDDDTFELFGVTGSFGICINHNESAHRGS